MAEQYHIDLAYTEADTRACFPVMRELRPHLSEAAFLEQVQRQSERGYRLASATVDGAVVGVAGFRLSEALAWGRYLYVDDLVTSAEHRSRGIGKALLEWLRRYAREHDCIQLHLDSGTQRTDAHRFYKREGMELSSYHFQERL